MAQWIETLEPYVKVIEKIRVASVQPTAGEDLIIGCVLISDAGPSVPTLITSQSEFLENYSSQDLTEDYINSLSSLYTGDDTALPATMWLNAYRLAGSANMLVVRASKGTGIYFAKALNSSDDSSDNYLVKDSEILKQVLTTSDTKLTLTVNTDSSNTNGWLISLRDVGTVGTYTTDDGAQYDYYINDIPSLIDFLNDTSTFYIPSYAYFDSDGNEIDEADIKSGSVDASSVSYVEIYEMYLGESVMDTETLQELVGDDYTDGLYNVTITQDGTTSIDLNDENWSGYTAPSYYARNEYNSNVDLKVRIRRFNHDAVITKELSENDADENGNSPYTVLDSVLDTFTSNGTAEPKDSILERDFFEFAVLDPKVDSEAQYYNVGEITGRGDIYASELADDLQSISLQLPDDLHDLGLGYYDYDYPDGTDVLSQIYVNVKIDPTETTILSVSDTNMMNSLDLIEEDEVYTTEGLTDLGNTTTMYQSYMANMAINSNYFYAISTVNSTNYVTIANGISRLSQDSAKLYASAPWDIDTGTVGWKFYASPSVLYWEAVCRNRNLDREFASVFGFGSTGVVQYQNPVVEFNKRQRQLLLSKKVNTVLWYVAGQTWNMNDCYTKESENNILNEDGNSRLNIRISKAMPALMKPLIGRKINDTLYSDAYTIIDYWFKSTIMPMSYTIDDYLITIADINTTTDQQANRMKVLIEVRYQRSLKYVVVYNEALDMGMDFTGTV